MQSSRSRFPATEDLADQIELDLAAHPAGVVLICCLDEESAPACAAWVRQQSGRLLVVDHEISRGVIRFPAGQYRLHKGGVMLWPDDGPPMIAPLFYIPVSEPAGEDALNLTGVLEEKLPESPDSVWVGW